MVIYNIQNRSFEVIFMPVGANIKKRRFALRMSQQELADAMGYKTRSTIAKIESGENDVSQKKLQKFASVLETTPEALMSGYFAAAPERSDERAVSSREQNVVIILAGGKAGQNRQNVPSQFVTVGGKPLLAYCMEVYQAHPAIDAIYVVCLKGWERIVEAYANQYGITKLAGLIPAQNTGVLSLKNAVDHISGQYSPQDLIIVQESTRPLITADTVSKLLQVCSEKDSATICHPMTDYVQFDRSGKKAKYIDRDAVIALQSPEAHRLSLITAVFERAAEVGHPLIETCCTMLLYNLGYPINFIDSPINNIKIAREEDIAAFKALIE